ncbi:hypothetical protein EPUS_03036 [Endocarpon pusillum Z07020]|uniref:Terpene cyclase/mutase family member n=1 Tax=Endocarpon pusillum (strain Z07020 / HMAS-L-300199) TaxID=1263415 RepID=U1HRR8_ENDPU|nr:uncharacterized protein EPUS_03036 [Endocarpon pusillum Z07020]ERF73195.1 hypothetical protein EPUS_03036 [Endocarpon pusillum Z07020]
MVQTRKGAQQVPIANGCAGKQNGQVIRPEKTDYSRWRLLDESGRQTWHYLTDNDEVQKWPQSIADKYHLGLPTGLPELPPATTPSQSIDNCLSFFSHLQLPPGNWACEYGGPLFLLPGHVITLYVTDTPIPPAYATEIKAYLFARQNKQDGGWGLHVEGESSVFGTALNYTILRILGASEEDERMIKARGKLHQLGGAVYGPHWAKFWLSVLGVMEWEAVNPVPPEVWLLPDWMPVAPWRWWIHMRQVFLPMSYIYSKRFVAQPTPLTRQLRQELYTQPYESLDFGSHRNSISDKDNYHPKTWLLNVINWLLVWIWFPYLRYESLVRRAEGWVWDLVQMEDENTDYAGLAPVNAPMNTLCCFIHDGPNSDSVNRHIDRLNDYMWMNKEGMLMNGTNGCQVWDTAFLIQAVIEAGLASSLKWKPMVQRAAAFLEDHQIREEVPNQEICYRQSRKGAWPFSTKVQGYTLSDCTAEALKVTLLLQNTHNYPEIISEERIRDAIDVLLTMRNPRSGGFASYEPQRGSELLEWLNAAEVFGRIMVEYDYPECTTAVVTVLSLFQRFSDYRKEEIDRIKESALKYIRRAMRQDGSWYGSWGICFTYAGMFALESLASVGENYENSAQVGKACEFLLSKQMDDGGWGEDYRSCERKEYVHHRAGSQVVQTAWAVIALMEAGYPGKEKIKKALAMVVGRQQRNGEWLQEGIEGVFNQSW